MATSIPVLADKGITVWLLDGKPDDPFEPTTSEINAGQDISCVLGRDFNVGAGSPQTTDDGPLCQGAGIQVPTGESYEATMSVIRKFIPGTRQIHVTDDFLFQLVKDFGVTFWIAVRDGGKDPRVDPDAVEGDEISVYEIMSGGAGRAADRSGYQKNQIYAYVQQGFEYGWVGGTAPTVPSP